MTTLTHRHRTSNRALRIDPTRTTGLRLRFMRDVNRRWFAIQRDIVTSIVDNDCFGIQPGRPFTFRSGLVTNAPIRPRQYAFERTPQKVELFMQWLEQQEAQGVLEIIYRPGIRPGAEAAWSDVYIQSSYQQGIRRGRAELRRAGYDVPSLDAVPGGVGAVMNQPIHADTVGLLYARTFDNLKSVTGIVNTQTRALVSEGLTTGLARGIAEGKNPRVIARELAKDVNHRVNVIGKTRMRMIARTEVIRAHHLANMGEYEQAQVEGVALVAEWLTAGDPCVICIDLSEGGPYKIEAARGMLPAHPNCRCVVVPVPKSQVEKKAV